MASAPHDAGGLAELKRMYISPGRCGLRGVCALPGIELPPARAYTHPTPHACRRVPELYDVGDVLGKGGFAVVRVGRERHEPGRVVAIKIINPKISADPLQQRMILDEVATMVQVNALSSPNLLRFVAAHEDFSTTTQCNRLSIVSGALRRSAGACVTASGSCRCGVRAWCAPRSLA